MKTRNSLFLIAGLLVLAGVFSDTRPALAQEQEACPHPPGVTPPPPPPVTAQQVEDGSATLAEFVLAATAQARRRTSETLTPQQLALAGCLLRAEGGPWRSGSTYRVTLTPDGRVFFHAKDMSLAGGSLNPSIYAGILSALGVPRTVLLGLRSQDPATRSRAQSTILDLLRSEPHAPFDLTSPVPGVRPGFPGASGYAGAYVAVDSGSPILLLAGFDLDASHLAEEAIDYGNPAITAEDVVDRGTLKAFVIEALKFLLGPRGTYVLPRNPERLSRKPGLRSEIRTGPGATIPSTSTSWIVPAISSCFTARFRIDSNFSLWCRLSSTS